MKYEAQRFADFIGKLPRDTPAALTLARGRDARVTGRAALTIGVMRPMRHAIEIRNETFLDSTFIDLLRKHNIAFVVADTGARWPQPADVTADYLYLRLHGATELYRSRYSDTELRRWAYRVRAWCTGEQPVDVERVLPDAQVVRIPRDVFCYFDNTDKLHAPKNVRRLMQLLELQWGPSRTAAPRRRNSSGAAR